MSDIRNWTNAQARFLLSHGWKPVAIGGGDAAWVKAGSGAYHNAINAIAKEKA